MVIALKMAKYLNKISLKELVSSLRSHEIELEEDEPHKQGKSLALKSNKKYKPKVLQEKEENSGGSSSEEDELYLLSKRVNQLWKHRKRKFRTPRRTYNLSESSSGYRKSSNKDIVCYKCNEAGHYKSDSPNLQKEIPNKNFSKDKKKSIMATLDESKSFEAET